MVLMKRKKLGFLVLPLISLIVALSIYYYYTGISPKISVKQTAINKCIELCEDALAKGIDLGPGPCLSDENPEWDIEKWVCDVAHSPREEVDNLRENQCDEWWGAYSAGREIHFVEVDPSCNLIRAV
jgi:hypothetical protein